MSNFNLQIFCSFQISVGKTGANHVLRLCQLNLFCILLFIKHVKYVFWVQLECSIKQVEGVQHEGKNHNNNNIDDNH